jgi:hypothetical protein
MTISFESYSIHDPNRITTVLGRTLCIIGACASADMYNTISYYNPYQIKDPITCWKMFGWNNLTRMFIETQEQQPVATVFIPIPDRSELSIKLAYDVINKIDVDIVCCADSYYNDKLINYIAMISEMRCNRGKPLLNIVPLQMIGSNQLDIVNNAITQVETWQTNMLEELYKYFAFTLGDIYYNYGRLNQFRMPINLAFGSFLSYLPPNSNSTNKIIENIKLIDDFSDYKETLVEHNINSFIEDVNGNCKTYFNITGALSSSDYYPLINYRITQYVLSNLTNVLEGLIGEMYIKQKVYELSNLVMNEMVNYKVIQSYEMRIINFNIQNNRLNLELNLRIPYDIRDIKVVSTIQLRGE